MTARSDRQPAGAWRPLQKPDRSTTRTVVGPFARLARTNAASAAGDALIALALAGSLFFDISPGAARSRVALYLLFTMAPFAVVAPLVGPLLDRVEGARRLVLIGTGAVRCAGAVLMIGSLKSNWLFPLAFIQLVLSKTYAVSRASLVPTVVRSEEELVEANAKLGLVSGLAGFAAAVPALLVRAIFGGAGVVALAAVAFGTMVVFAARLPSTKGSAFRAATDRVHETENAALVRNGGITLAASAMGFLRAAVGFLAFHLAFWFKGEELAALWFGFALSASALGTMTGGVVAPRIRTRVQEESMVLGALGAVGAAGLLAAFQGGRAGAVFLAFMVGFGASLGRLAFDAIVQRDANDANRGRAFAQFETRFQLAWVLAAFVPVLVNLPGWLGFVVVGGFGLFALVSYLAGTAYLRRTGQVPRTLTKRAVGELKRRRANEIGRSARDAAKRRQELGGRPLPPPEPPGRWQPPD